MTKFIKYIIFFYVFFSNRVLFSMEGEGYDTRDIDADYNNFFHLPRIKNNFLLTVGALSTLGGLYYVANTINKDILKGESFSGLFSRFNLHKDKIFLANEWIKKLIIPLGGYITIGNFFIQKNNINAKHHTIGKLIMNNDAFLILDKNKLHNIYDYNFWEQSAVATWIMSKDSLRDKYYPIRDTIKKYFNIAYDRATNKKSTEYYNTIEAVENAIENFVNKQNPNVLNLEQFTLTNVLDQKKYMPHFLQRICQNRNQELKNDFQKKMIGCRLKLGVILLMMFSLYYACDLAKKYIEKNGLGHGNPLTQFFYNKKWYTLIKLICANVDWIYWSLGVIQYVVLPGISLKFGIDFFRYQYNNSLSCSLNRVFALNINFFVDGPLKVEEILPENLEKQVDWPLKVEEILPENLEKQEEIKSDFLELRQAKLNDIYPDETIDNIDCMNRVITFNNKMINCKSLQELRNYLYYKKLEL